MANDNPLESFRHALAGATRALAGDAEIELSFTRDAPSLTGKAVKAPMPGRAVAEYYQRVFGKDLSESVVGTADAN